MSLVMVSLPRYGNTQERGRSGTEINAFILDSKGLMYNLTLEGSIGGRTRYFACRTAASIVSLRAHTILTRSSSPNSWPIEL